MIPALSAARRHLLACIPALFIAAGTATAQGTGQIGGTVTAEDGRALNGAAIVVEGTELRALTNATGRFDIANVPAGQRVVSVRMLGFGSLTDTVTVVAGQETTVNFQLALLAMELDGVVVVGYGTQTRSSVTGAISSVGGEELEAIPTANLSNTITGKLPGVVSVNPSGEPGADGSTLRIRGSHTLNDNSPLVVIDGVPDRAGGLERLRAEDIESLSVLKDASAAIYGSRAANGVILVTTKRGQAGSPRISMSVNQGFTQPTRIPEMADARTYMMMLNEIDTYQSRPERFTAEEIALHADPNSDPWLYPDTDWFDATLKDFSAQTRVTGSLRGGSERINYYLSLGGSTEDGFYRNSGTRYNQFDFRSNLDGNVSEAVKLRLDVSGRLEDRNYPTRSAGAIFRSIMRGKPNMHAYWPNGMPGPDIVEPGSTVVVSVHIPLMTTEHHRRRDQGISPGGTVANREAIYRLLEPYNAYVLSGHMHENEHLREGGARHHVAGTVCGGWWSGPICFDGTPNGYPVYEANGQQITQRYKPTSLPFSHQLRAYRSGIDPKAPNEIVANVWNWDPEWSVVWYEGSDRRGSMARRIGLDPWAVELKAGPWANDHLFYAPVSPTADNVVVEATDAQGRKYTSRVGDPMPLDPKIWRGDVAGS